MASVGFETSRSPVFSSAAPFASAFRSVARPARTRLALVSSYNELCGIAAYTKSLKNSSTISSR